MKTELLFQLIDTAGIILSPLSVVCLTYFLIKKLYSIRERFDCGTDLLKEAAFYRNIIDQYAKYCAEFSVEEKQMKQEFWDNAKRVLNQGAPSQTTPARIKRRLKELSQLTEDLDRALSKLDC